MEIHPLLGSLQIYSGDIAQSLLSRLSQRRCQPCLLGTLLSCSFDIHACGLFQNMSWLTSIHIHAIQQLCLLLLSLSHLDMTMHLSICIAHKVETHLRQLMCHLQNDRSFDMCNQSRRVPALLLQSSSSYHSLMSVSISETVWSISSLSIFPSSSFASIDLKQDRIFSNRAIHT